MSFDIKDERYSRNEGIIGKKGIAALMNSSVMVVGIGGVGGFVCEALVRAGIGHLIVVDGDDVEPSNLNRQIIADTKTIGMPKVEAMKERVLLVNPDVRCDAVKMRVSKDNIETLPFAHCDYIVDACDDVPAKILLIKKAKELANDKAGRPFVISAMGAANKVDATKFEVADINDTSTDPLARAVRRELRKEGIRDVKVVYSKEKAVRTDMKASLSYVPPVCGMIIAGEVIKDLARYENKL